MTSELSFTPIYEQVREELLRRLIDGRWPPGTMLPSQIELADEFGVSQGTLRKAIESLAAENLLDRQKGRGTFVRVPEEGRLLFQFFRLKFDDGGRFPPMSVIHGIRRVRADAATAGPLRLSPDDEVWEVDRTRDLDGRPVIVEKLYLPVARFPGLDAIETLPNSIYSLYATRYGTTVGRAEERVKAVAATEADAAAFGCPAATPLLLIDRTAYALDGTPVERRVSRCITDGLHYWADLH
ncbi:GntR family transcriptional regulator [Faunimonas sp. B44]|uniref:GntR family transcriptional regulator n=1 Tax=Faunimonas sp. B44 TaxID=3461493 RepID=UPI004044E090